MNLSERHRTRLRVESLEDRCTPAGDVTGFVSGGTLTLLGDFNHNRIEIRPAGPGAYRVRGTEEATWGPTTVNGLDEDFFFGVSSIRTEMSEGKDMVWVNGIALPGTLTINTNSREDNILVTGSTITGETTINSGTEDDHIQIIDSKLESSLTVNGENGGDLLGVFRSTIKDDTTVDMAEGFDRVLFGFITSDLTGGVFLGSVKVDLGRGENRFESLRSLYEGPVSVTGGDGGDFFEVSDSTFRGRSRLSSLTGNDRITVRRSSFRKPVAFDAGAGRDRVEAFSTVFTSSVRFVGGTGFDRLDWLGNGNTYGGPTSRTGFEVEL